MQLKMESDSICSSSLGSFDDEDDSKEIEFVVARSTTIKRTTTESNNDL